MSKPTAVTEKKMESELTGETLWEKVATTTWGQYVTGVERDLIQQGQKLAGTPGRALEVGCEGGRWSKMLTQAGWEMTCTDISAEVLQICQRKVPSAKCILVDISSRTLPCEAGSVSLTLCVEVPPVIQSDWFLPEANRVLKENGVLVGTFLNRSSWRGMQARLRNQLSGKDDRRFYTQSYPAWRKNLLAAGFEFVFEQGFCWSPFSRASNSSLVPFFTGLERSLGLNKLVSSSPWIAFIARKKLPVK